MNAKFIQVAAFYKFIELKDLPKIQNVVFKFLSSKNIFGTVLIANEGINGTVAGTKKSIKSFHGFLEQNNLLSSENFKTSFCQENPFPRLKVKLKNEIVSIGNSFADPSKIVGKYVEPEDWNHLISQEDVLVLDTRNTYEVSIGTFEKSIQPKTTNFREFPEWLEDLNCRKYSTADGERQQF